MTSVFTRDPDSRLDYMWDWSRWLAKGETVIDRSIMVTPTGLTVEARTAADAITNDGTAVVEWVSGGQAGKRYQLTCRVTTSTGRQDDRTMTIRCKAN